MSIRYHLAKTAGKFTKWTLKRLNKGATSLPGKVALKIDPKFLSHHNKDLKVIMITGTNGKTLTTTLTTHILKQKYDVLTNESGSNMIQGITTTLLDNNKAQMAVLEVDEANLKKLTPHLKPEVIVFTNVFRDQMDRFGEIYTTYQYMCDGAKVNSDTTLIVNGDTPLFNYDTLINPKKFYGFNHTHKQPVTLDTNTDGILCPRCENILTYDLNTYANLGSYTCPHCQFSRPELDYEVTKLIDLKTNQSTFEINHHAFTIEIGGLYNIYNALAAYSVGKFYDLTDDQIQQGFTNTPMKFGRQEVFSLKDKNIILNLVKNPVGFNQIVDLISLDKDPKSIVALLNDNYADGVDVSWIWDANYEKLSTLNVQSTLISGIRVEDLHKRMEVAQFQNIQPVSTLSEVVNTLDTLPTKNIYVLATYTALLALRELLSKENLVDGAMK